MPKNVAILLPLPEIGQKIVLSRRYDFDPQSSIPQGASGTVVSSELSGILVKMDNHWSQLLDHSNHINFYDVSGGNGLHSGTTHNGFELPVVLEFHLYCDYVD